MINKKKDISRRRVHAERHGILREISFLVEMLLKRRLLGLFCSFPITAFPFTTNEPQSYVLGGINHPLHINSENGKKEVERL